MPEEKEGETPQETPAEKEKTFTQVELDKIIDARLTRERKKYEGYDQLKADASEWRKHLDAQKSDMEKMQSQLSQEQNKALTLEQEMTELRIKTAVVMEASKKGAADTEDVYKLLDLASVEISEDGRVVGVAEAVDALLESKPYLVKSAKAQASTTSPAQPPAAGEPSDRLSTARLTKIMRARYGPGWEAPKGEGGAFDADAHLDQGGGIVMSGLEFGKVKEEQSEE